MNNQYQMDSTLRLKYPETISEDNTNSGVSDRVRLGIIAGLVVLSLALRLFDLGTGSLWFDTAHSVALADSKNIAEVFSGAAKDFQAPFYFILLHFWIKLGYSDLWVKLFSVLLGTAVVVMTFITAESMFSRRTAILGALLTSLSSYQVFYSRYPRAYMLMALLALISIWALYTAIREGRVRSWVIYTIVTVLGLYTHAYYIFVAIAEIVFFLTLVSVRRGEDLKLLRPWEVSQAIVLLTFIPWISVTWSQWTGIQEGADSWIAPVGLESLQQLYFWLWHRTKEDYPYLASIPLWLGIYLMTTLLLFSLFSRPVLRRIEGNGWWEKWMLWCVTVCPVFLAFSISLLSSTIWHPRYLVYISAPFYILVAQAIINLKDRIPALGRPARLRRAFNIAALGMILAVSLPPLDTLYSNPSYRTPELKESFTWIQSQYRQGDMVMHIHYQSYLPYLWYAQSLGPKEQVATHTIPCVWESLPQHWCTKATYRQSLLSQETGGISHAQLGADRVWLVGLYEHRQDGAEGQAEEAVDGLIRDLYQKCSTSQILDLSVHKFLGVNIYELKQACG